MEWFKKWIEHGLRHLTLSFVFALFGVDAMISAIATWLLRTIWAGLGATALPARYYILLGLLMFCAVTLFALFVVLLNRSARRDTSPEFPPVPSVPPPPPALEMPKTVDLKGRIQELYLARFDDFIGVTTAYVAVYGHVVNHGSDEVTLTECGLYASLGSFRAEGKVLQVIPDTWRIKKRRENTFIPAIFDEHPLASILNSHDTYKKGIPHQGWLAFEFTLIGDEVEFPNVQMDLFLRDSLGNPHTITRR